MKKTLQNILILGGYGRAGCEIANLLLRHATVELTLAGRNLERAEAAAAQLNRGYSANRVKAARVDITQRHELIRAFSRCNLVIVTVPFKGNAAQTVIAAAVEAGIDYIDINTDSSKHSVFATQSDRIQQSNQIFLTEAGIIPGCPAVMVRWTAQRFGQLLGAAIGSLMQDPQMPRGSVYDMVAHAGKSAELYRDGRWQQASLLTIRWMDFDRPYGFRLCVPVSLPELRSLPEQIAIDELGVYQAGFNPAVDTIFLLWKTLGLNRFEWGIAGGMRLFQWANQQFTSPPYGITLTLESQNQRLLTLNHPDVYRGTAIPVVAAVQQILAGRIQRPWQGFMGQGVVPELFMEAVQELGLTVRAV